MDFHIPRFEWLLQPQAGFRLLILTHVGARQRRAPLVWLEFVTRLGVHATLIGSVQSANRCAMTPCPACQTPLDETRATCPVCGALNADSAWMALWMADYDARSADPEVHAAHQQRIAERVLRDPDAYDSARIVW